MPVAASAGKPLQRLLCKHGCTHALITTHRYPRDLPAVVHPCASAVFFCEACAHVAIVQQVMAASIRWLPRFPLH